MPSWQMPSCFSLYCQVSLQNSPMRVNKEDDEINRRVFVDMDGVLANSEEKAEQLQAENTHPDFIPYYLPGFYRDLAPLPNAIESFMTLSAEFDVWILSKPSWENPSSVLSAKFAT